MEAIENAYEQYMQCVQSRPKQMIKAARDGDIAALKIITACIPDAPQLQTQEVLEMALSHLSDSKALEVTRAAGSRPSLRVVSLTEHAETAMAAVAAFSSVDFKAKRREPPISESWPGVFKWMKFLVKIYMSSSYTKNEDRAGDR